MLNRRRWQHFANVSCNRKSTQVGAHGAQRRAYLKRFAELHRHDVVEDGVDGGGDVVQDATDVRDDLVNFQHLAVVVDVVLHDEVRVEALHVKRRPAYEEGYHNSD